MKVLRRNKRGLTLVELVLVLAVIGLVVIALLAFYNTTVRPSAWINEKVQSFANLQAALEQARSINGGRYPNAAANNPINLGNLGNGSSEQILRAVLGSSNPQYNQWTYVCDNGNLTIKIYVGDETNVDRQNAVRTAILRNFVGWTCGDVSGGSFTCSRSNVPCG